jgi:hypothetical protein
MNNKRWLCRCIIAAGVLAISAFALAACDDDNGDGGGDADVAEIESAVRAVLDAWNDKDVDAWVGLLTDDFIQEEFDGATREEALASAAEFIGEPQQEFIALSDIEVSGDTATAVLDSSMGNVLLRERGTLVREDDVWRVDAVESLPVDIPEGTTAVDVSAFEYQFDFDGAAITDGNIAFEVENIGAEEHFLFLARVPEDLDIEQALQSEEEPEGVEDIGGTDIIGPGETQQLVFTEALAEGRYVMLCFVEASDGEDHASKGMWAEFHVGGDAAGETPAQ